MISKAKLKKVQTLAGQNFKYFEAIPAGVAKKCTAEQLADLCKAFASNARIAYESANAERTARNVARFHPGGWVRRARAWFSDWFRPVALPKLAIGVASIRARFTR